MTSTSKRPGVIVQGSGLNGLGVVRSLAVERVSVTVVDRSPGGPAVDSRHAVAALYTCDDANAEPALIEALLRAARSFDEPPVLLLTQEAAVAAVSQNRNKLTPALRMQIPNVDVVAELTDKTGFQRRAEALGFPVPRSTVMDASSNLAAVAALTFPCVLKPAIKSEYWERTHKKAYRFDEFATLEAFWRSVDDKPPIIVQEWIEGGDSDVYFTLVHRDEAGGRASFTGRKIRQWPPFVGGTASCMPAPEAAAELDALTHRFFDAVGLVGLASMEYKRDRRSGRFSMVEPTIGRTDYQEEIATLNGVNLIQTAYRSVAGLPRAFPNPPRPAAVWQDSIGDANSRAAQPHAKDPVEMAAMRIVDALYRVGDPGPWLKSQYQRVARRLTRVTPD